MSGAKGSSGLVWVALGASLWGTDTVLRRPLTRSLSSSEIVMYEHLILALVLLGTAWRNRSQWQALNWRQWSAVLGIAWGGSALGTVCFTEAIRTGNPTTAVLLQKTQPIFATLLARVILREHLGRRFWVYLLLALCGAYLVSFGKIWPFGYVAQGGGAMLAISAAALWGGSTVLGRLVLEKLSFATLTALRIIIAAPLLLAINWAAVRSPSLPSDSRQVLSLLLLALVPGLLALLIYYRGLRHTRASLAALAELSFPATATLLNWLVLGAGVSPLQVAGFALLWSIILSLSRRGYD